MGDDMDAKIAIQRRRHRENMSRYRNKKKATLEAMKVRQQVLAAQLESMLQLHAAHSQSYQSRYCCTDGGELQDSREYDRQSPPCTAMDGLVHLLTEKAQLEQANASLRGRMQQHSTFRELVHDASAEVRTEDEELYQGRTRPRSAAAAATAARGRWIQFVEHEAPFYYVPFTDVQCLNMVAQTLQQVHDFQTLGMSQSSSTARVARFFNWSASLHTEWDAATQTRMMRYQFLKTFRNPARSIDQVVDVEWRVLHDPKLYQTLHTMPVHVHVLQRISDDVSVVMLNAPHPSQSLRFRSVSVLARSEYQDPRGRVGRLVTMAKQPLKLSAHVTSQGEQVEYLGSGFLGTAFMPGSDGEIGVEYGGLVPVPSEEQARFLMVGIGCALVRLETLLFPFRVLASS